MNRKQIIILALFAAAISAWFFFDLGSYLSLEVIKSSMGDLRAYYAENPWTARLAYLVVYIAVTGLSLPGAVVLTLAGGALFGFWYGL